MNNDFLKSMYNDDTIFHYTKASTAIDYILFNQELRFSKAASSSDPIESKIANRGTIYCNYESPLKQSKEHYDDINMLHNMLANLESKFSQICFCKNTLGSNYYGGTLLGNEELFGFTKLRMWDQYADKFTGVCIAFSKEKLLSLNNSQFDLIVKSIKYLNFQGLISKKIGDIHGDYLTEVGKDKCEEELKRALIESFFCKHLDYSGENELRIGTFFESKKCSLEIVRDEMIFDQSMMLNITNCVKAIFVSSYANAKQKKQLLDYAYLFNIELIEIKWRHNSFELQDYKKFIESINRMETK